MMNTYRLDPAWNQVEFLSTRLMNMNENTTVNVVRPLSQKEPRGLFTLLVEAVDEGGNSETFQVRLKIKLFADVIVATDRLGWHQMISEEVVRVERMEVTNLYDQPATSLADVVGKRTSRNISRGAIVTSSACEAIPQIEAGRPVSIVFAGDLYTVTAHGKALQDGYTGDYVKVKNQSSGKVLKAQVVDENEVRVGP
jgi:flagella basal body P-ring formation protein FlgA